MYVHSLMCYKDLRETITNGSKYGKITGPFCSTLALFAIPRSTALGLQSGTVDQTGVYNFYIKGKKKKQNSSLSNQVHNSPLTSLPDKSYLTVGLFNYSFTHITQVQWQLEACCHFCNGELGEQAGPYACLDLHSV